MATESAFPADRDRITLGASLRWQRRACADLGATLSADLVAFAADAVDAGDPFGRLVGDAARAAGLVDVDGLVRYGDLAGLRLLAVAHRAVLERTAPALAVHYPTVGGTRPLPGAAGAAARLAARAAFAESIGADRDRLVAGLGRVPQTNETGRAPLLRHAMGRLVPAAMPLRLREIGASAGLNLRADRLLGLPRLEPEGLTMPDVVDRRGCDVAPLDVRSAADRITLSSYVWADDTERFARLAAAIRIAVEVPAVLDRADAASFLAAQRTVPGTGLMLWHSAMWVYLATEQRRDSLSAIRRLSREASPESPMWHVSWEWRPGAVHAEDWFALVARGWPAPTGPGLPDAAAGAPLLLATGSSHGRAVRPRWPAEVLGADPVTVE